MQRNWCQWLWRIWAPHCAWCAACWHSTAKSAAAVRRCSCRRRSVISAPMRSWLALIRERGVFMLRCTPLFCKSCIALNGRIILCSFEWP
ncbi:hypothetical protein EDC01DRAFT_647996 [Geopyxis carbonaria]|nr:hypothetical protein EDC01DRAFT_647996 [Geopyxis carbonaria]